jgi:hypothetical protein
MIAYDDNYILGKRFVYDVSQSHETNFYHWAMLSDAEAELDSNFGVKKYSQEEKERIFERQWGHKRKR